VSITRPVPQTIRTAHEDGSHGRADGWVYPDAPGLAMVTTGHITSTVTHLATGRRVCFIMGDLPEREAALVQIAALADWTAVEVDMEVKARVVAIAGVAP